MLDKNPEVPDFFPSNLGKSHSNPEGEQKEGEETATAPERKKKLEKEEDPTPLPPLQGEIAPLESSVMDPKSFRIRLNVIPVIKAQKGILVSYRNKDGKIEFPQSFLKVGQDPIRNIDVILGYELGVRLPKPQKREKKMCDFCDIEHEIDGDAGLGSSFMITPITKKDGSFFGGCVSGSFDPGILDLAVVVLMEEKTLIPGPKYKLPEGKDLNLIPSHALPKNREEGSRSKWLLDLAEEIFAILFEQEKNAEMSSKKMMYMKLKIMDKLIAEAPDGIKSHPKYLERKAKADEQRDEIISLIGYKVFEMFEKHFKENNMEVGGGSLGDFLNLD